MLDPPPEENNEVKGLVKLTHMHVLPRDILSSVETNANFRQQAGNHQKHGLKPCRYLTKPSSKKADACPQS